MSEYIIDAKNKKLGRIASEAAVVLQGKKNPSYEKRLPGNDFVLVKNLSKLDVSGRKFDDKIYYKHGGPLGHLKETKFREKFARDPKWVLLRAVRLMLPKNRLNKKRLLRLKVE